jgi:hypothetical protein
MTPQELEEQTARRLDALRRELAGRVEAERVAEVGRGHFERLSLHASIPDFIPLLVYRYAKEELLYSTEDQLHHAA